MKSSNIYLTYSTIGIQLALTILLFLYAGYKLDIHNETSPLYIIIFAFSGLGLGFYNLIKSLKNIENIKPEDTEEVPKNNKWLFK